MSIKLTYFNAKGLAEVSRILLALAQVDYVDYRYPIDVIDPVNHEYKRELFDHDKSTGKLDSSMGKLPVLEITDKRGNHVVIPQSKAIERYLSKKYGFMGTNLLEEARIDSICECVRDIKEHYAKMNFSQQLEYFHDGGVFEKELHSLVNVLDFSSKFAVGSSLSLADVSIYSLITHHKPEALEIAGKNARIRDIVMKVASRPEVVVWMQKRPKTTF